MKTYALVIRKDEQSKKVAKELQDKLQGILELDEKNPDLVIGVGGDGTILHSVHHYLDRDCCFIGVHTGTLGFLTDYKSSQLDELVRDIQNNNFIFDTRQLLKISIETKDSKKDYYALNEVRLDHGFKTQVIDIYINDTLLETFRGNGLCVSTPSGSTAYNKSLNGAVLYPGATLMQLTEVAAISNNAYRGLGSSLVLDENQTITLTGKNFDKVFMGVDHLDYELDDVKKITINIGTKGVKFGEFHKIPFIERVRRAFIQE